MPAIDWRNLGKLWQNGETSSQKNGVLQNFQLTAIVNNILLVTSGWKDSGMEGGKKMLCLGIFSTRHKHNENLCL